jgi:hypothetical protein
MRPPAVIAHWVLNICVEPALFGKVLSLQTQNVRQTARWWGTQLCCSGDKMP